MTQIRKPSLTLAFFVLTSRAYFLPAQTQGASQPVTGGAVGQQISPPPKPAPAFYRNLIVLDPAHGGRDNGARLSNNSVEKEITLAFAQKLRPALVAQGFTVVATRDAEPSEELTTDQRAGTANHIRPLACIVIHATAVGSGIHVVSSSLKQSDTKSSAGRAIAWNSAQAPTIAMSLRLANEVGLAMEAAHLPVLLLRASIPPLDNLICPAVAIELAPLQQGSGKTTPVFDSGYQQRAAIALAQALASFRAHNAPAPVPPGAGSRIGAPQ